MASSHCPEPISIEDYREILRRFLSENAYQTGENDPDIENTIIERFRKYNMSEKKAKALAFLGASAAAHCYCHHTKEIQQAVASFTAYLMAVEDLGPEFLTHIQRFRHDILHDSPQIPVLEDYTNLCKEFDEYYSDFCSDRITVATLNFVSSTVFEFQDHDFQKLATAPNFPHYFRYMTGLSEAYAWLLLPKEMCSQENLELFIQTVPDLIDYTNVVNDLFSFYKETIASNEKNNSVYLRAERDKCGIKDVLCSMSEEIKEYMARLRACVSDNPAMFQIVDTYLQGHIGFHMSEPRYKLEEIGLSLSNI